MSFQGKVSLVTGGATGIGKATAMAPYGITVNAVVPGFCETKMFQMNSQEKRKEVIRSIPLGRVARPGVHAASTHVDPAASEKMNGIAEISSFRRV